MATSQTTTNQRHPWGRAMGILTGCFVTFLGVIARLDPEIILFRVFVAGVLAAMVTRIALDLIPAIVQID